MQRQSDCRQVERSLGKPPRNALASWEKKNLGSKKPLSNKKFSRWRRAIGRGGGRAGGGVRGRASGARGRHGCPAQASEGGRGGRAQQAGDASSWVRAARIQPGPVCEASLGSGRGAAPAGEQRSRAQRGVPRDVRCRNGRMSVMRCPRDAGARGKKPRLTRRKPAVPGVDPALPAPPLPQVLTVAGEAGARETNPGRCGISRPLLGWTLHSQHLALPKRLHSV